MLQRLLFSMLLLTVSTMSFAQVTAMTEQGDWVILYADSTWEYLEQAIPAFSDSIQLNATPFTKEKKATFLVKSKINKSGIWINPKKWKFSKDIDNEDAEFELRFKGKSLYALIITEDIEMSIERLRQLALENALSVAPDLEILKEEKRKVNGEEVLALKMKGTNNGVQFMYYGYYFTNEHGSTQFIVLSSANILEPLEDEALKMLNGLVQIPND